MVKKDKDFEVPALDMKDEKVKAILGHSSVERPIKTEKKVVPVHLFGEDVELFNRAYKGSTSKSEKDFATSIILNHLKRGD